VEVDVGLLPHIRARGSVSTLLVTTKANRLKSILKSPYEYTDKPQSKLKEHEYDESTKQGQRGRYISDRELKGWTGHSKDP
jgi:hypothetical protein